MDGLRPILRCLLCKIEVRWPVGGGVADIAAEDSMAERRPKREESGEQRQERIQREQHTPKQNEGYDEAVRRPGIANDREIPPDQRPRRDI